MSLDFEDKVFVGLIAGTLAVVAAVNVLKPAESTSAARIGRTFQVASASEQPHYAIKYTFPRISKECRAETIAAQDQARCDVELARRPTETVRLIAPASTYAFEPGNTVAR